MPFSVVHQIRVPDHLVETFEKDVSQRGIHALLLYAFAGGRCTFLRPAEDDGPHLLITECATQDQAQSCKKHRVSERFGSEVEETASIFTFLLAVQNPRPPDEPPAWVAEVARHFP